MMGDLKMGDPSKYTQPIEIFTVKYEKNKYCEQKPVSKLFTECWANIKTIKAHTLFMQDSNYEKAYTRFIIRYSKKVMDAYYDGPYMLIEFRGQNYKVQYLHNIDEMNIEIEIQAVRCKYECKKI